jgi:hypothetical protein
MASVHLGAAPNRGWGWNWSGKCRTTGKVRTYYTRTSFGDKGTLRDHVEFHFRGIQFLDGAPADRDQLQTFPMPPESFQAGNILTLPEVQDYERYRAGYKPLTRSPMRTLLPRISVARIEPSRR